MKITFDHAIVVKSWDTLELDMAEKKAYVKDQGMNTHDIVRFRVIEDGRDNND